MLFGKKKKPAKTANAKQAAPKLKRLWSREFVQSPTFKGFRKIRLSRYYYEDIDRTLNILKKEKYALDDRRVRLALYESTDPYNEYRVVKVYIDNMLIGCVFNSDEANFPLLTQYKYDKVHIQIDDSAPDVFIENVVTAKATLFVHYPDGSPIKVKVE